jgi:hypothetical protein
MSSVTLVTVKPHDCPGGHSVERCSGGHHYRVRQEVVWRGRAHVVLVVLMVEVVMRMRGRKREWRRHHEVIRMRIRRHVRGGGYEV